MQNQTHKLAKFESEVAGYSTQALQDLQDNPRELEALAWDFDITAREAQSVLDEFIMAGKQFEFDFGEEFPTLDEFIDLNSELGQEFPQIRIVDEDPRFQRVQPWEDDFSE